MVPETTSEDLGYFDQLLETLSQLVGETAWPETKQGEFLRYAADDVLELSFVIRAAAGTGRFTAATALMRPLHERSEYLLAAAIEPGFADEHEAYIKKLAERELESRPTARKMDRVARAIIGSWEERVIPEPIRLKKKSETLYGRTSEIQHRGVGASRAARQNPEERHGALVAVRGQVETALRFVLLTVAIVGMKDTQAWRRAKALVLP